jgi:hypothetical protein
MSNFELIDDYLSNRLNGSEKEAFEKQLENDPSLKSDLDFQKQIITGIRTARATELKAILSKVPVGGTGVSMDFSVVRMAAGIVAAGVVGAAIYFYATHGELPPFNKAATDLNQKTEELKKPEATEPDVTKVVTDSTGEKVSAPAPIKESSKPKQEPVKPVEKPKLDVTDPSADLQQDNSSDDEPAANIHRSDISPSHVQVNIDSSNKKFGFHYQFVSNKLMLFGDFDRALYEVLEINGDNHALFFVYKDAYYLLDENQHKVTKLEPIKDSALISKLREYRK